MKLGHFNVHASFQTPDLRGVFPGPSAEEYYYGISLGGIMGTYLAGLSPDIEKFHVDVPSIDFNILLQRSTQFNTFELLLTAIGFTDPMKTMVGQALQHELWVSAEPASIARNVTGLVDPPLPGVGAKKILMSVAFLDKQVSNQGSELMARTLGIGNLEGSLLRDFIMRTSPDRRPPRCRSGRPAPSTCGTRRISSTSRRWRTRSRATSATRTASGRRSARACSRCSTSCSRAA